MGLTEAKLAGLGDFESCGAYSEDERLVIRLAVAMTRTPARIDNELFAALRRRFDDKQLVELASAIAWENHRARFNRVFDIGSDDFSEGHFCALPVRD